MQLCSFHLSYRMHTWFINELHFCFTLCGNECVMQTSLGNEIKICTITQQGHSKLFRGDAAKVMCVSMQVWGHAPPADEKITDLETQHAQEMKVLMTKPLQMEQQLDQCTRKKSVSHKQWKEPALVQCINSKSWAVVWPCSLGGASFFELGFAPYTVSLEQSNCTKQGYSH